MKKYIYLLSLMFILSSSILVYAEDEEGFVEGVQLPTGSTPNYAPDDIVVVPINISIQPKDATVLVNSDAVFTCIADGEGLTYQWQYRSKPENGWNNSSSATVGYNTNTLVVRAAIVRNGYQYRCIVTNAKGERVESEVATLSVSETAIDPPPVEDNNTLVEFGYLVQVDSDSNITLARIYNLLLTMFYFMIIYVVYRVIVRNIRKGRSDHGVI